MSDKAFSEKVASICAILTVVTLVIMIILKASIMIYTGVGFTQVILFLITICVIGLIITTIIDIVKRNLKRS